MATKKSVAPKKAVRKPIPKAATLPPENITEHGSLKLSDVQRLTLNWEGAELKSLSSSLKLKTAEYEAYLKKIDPQGTLKKLHVEVTSLSDAVKVQESKFISSCKEIGEKLRLDSSQKWSYDDVTGLVHLEEKPSK